MKAERKKRMQGSHCPEGDFNPVSFSNLRLSSVVCLTSAARSCFVGPCEHSAAAAGEGSDGGRSGCHEAHTAVPRLRDGTQRCHTHPHQR